MLQTPHARNTASTMLLLILTLLALPLALAGQTSGEKKYKLPEFLKGAEIKLLPARKVTHGPAYHWFSYYDVNQFDPSGRHILAMAVNFEGRLQTAEDSITLGMIDLKDHDRWTTIGTTRAWCWQQGCRLQWRPGSDREILWNDREGDKFVARVLDIKTRKMRTLPYPIDHLSPDGKWSLSGDYARTFNNRASYGYAGVKDPFENEAAPAGTGGWKMNLDTGERTLLFSLADIAKMPTFGYTPETPGRHYVNHFGWAPGGNRFLFLNRSGDTNKIDRMFTADADGKNIRFIHYAPSHFCWQDNETIIGWSRNAYRIFKADGSDGPDGKILYQAPNGHETILRGGEWMITDTYPQKADRNQYLYLVHLPDMKFTVIGIFHEDLRYDAKTRGEQMWRCDLHPRLSPDQKLVTIDSVDEGGRQIYTIDISGIVGKK